jgi:hypothetical protein
MRLTRGLQYPQTYSRDTYTQVTQSRWCEAPFLSAATLSLRAAERVVGTKHVQEPFL